MNSPPRVLDATNIDKTISDYATEIEELGGSLAGKRGRVLLHHLKRESCDIGRYAHVSLFEAANRIMTDLLLLDGVKWLLVNRAFPFESYTIQYGHENSGPYDIEAQSNGKRLCGESFNVSPSFFPLKKAAMLKKLRDSAQKADYRLIVVNADAVTNEYLPRARPGEHLLIVHVGEGHARLVPEPSAL